MKLPAWFKPLFCIHFWVWDGETEYYKHIKCVRCDKTHKELKDNAE